MVVHSLPNIRVFFTGGIPVTSRKSTGTLPEPYVIHYPRIVAVADASGKNVELVEFFDCTGGAMWSKHHYAQSPLVQEVRYVGPAMRYLLKTGTVDLALEGSRFPAGISSCMVDDREITVTYIGMGGGGVGAAACRSDAAGVLRSRCDPAGGGKVAGATIWLSRMKRVLVGVDDTDTPEEGATWTLVHNIARAVEDEHSIYLSHTIVQLFPVPYRTKNCVALVAEFASDDPEGLIARFRDLLEKYTLSPRTGMAVYTGFSPSADLLAYGWKVKRGEVEAGLLESIRDPDLRLIMKGRGIVGAVAAIPFFTRYREALELCSGKN
jgi:methanogenesis imperfect marker protein 11